jgi:cytochrome b6-f complex subunit 5
LKLYYEENTRITLITIWIVTRRLNLIEPILLGIVLGLIPVTIAGLFVAAYLQYRRGNELGL